MFGWIPFFGSSAQVASVQDSQKKPSASDATPSRSHPQTNQNTKTEQQIKKDLARFNQLFVDTRKSSDSDGASTPKPSTPFGEELDLGSLNRFQHIFSARKGIIIYKDDGAPGEALINPVTGKPFRGKYSDKHANNTMKTFPDFLSFYRDEHQVFKSMPGAVSFKRKNKKGEVKTALIFFNPKSRVRARSKHNVYANVFSCQTYYSDSSFDKVPLLGKKNIGIVSREAKLLKLINSVGKRFFNLGVQGVQPKPFFEFEDGVFYKFPNGGSLVDTLTVGRISRLDLIPSLGFTIEGLRLIQSLRVLHLGINSESIHVHRKKTGRVVSRISDFQKVFIVPTVTHKDSIKRRKIISSFTKLDFMDIPLAKNSILAKEFFDLMDCAAQLNLDLLTYEARFPTTNTFREGYFKDFLFKDALAITNKISSIIDFPESSGLTHDQLDEISKLGTESTLIEVESFHTKIMKGEYGTLELGLFFLDKHYRSNGYLKGFKKFEFIESRKTDKKDPDSNEASSGGNSKATRSAPTIMSPSKKEALLSKFSDVMYKIVGEVSEITFLLQKSDPDNPLASFFFIIEFGSRLDELRDLLLEADQNDETLIDFFKIFEQALYKQIPEQITPRLDQKHVLNLFYSVTVERFMQYASDQNLLIEKLKDSIALNSDDLLPSEIREDWGFRIPEENHLEAPKLEGGTLSPEQTRIKKLKDSFSKVLDPIIVKVFYTDEKDAAAADQIVAACLADLKKVAASLVEELRSADPIAEALGAVMIKNFKNRPPINENLLLKFVNAFKKFIRWSDCITDSLLLEQVNSDVYGSSLPQKESIDEIEARITRGLETYLQKVRDIQVFQVGLAFYETFHLGSGFQENPSKTLDADKPFRISEEFIRATPEGFNSPVFDKKSFKEVVLGCLEVDPKKRLKLPLVDLDPGYVPKID